MKAALNTEELGSYWGALSGGGGPPKEGEVHR